MTARPDVLGPDERADAAWASLTSHHYRHLPVVEGGRCVGVVSLRDLMAVARIRPGQRDERGRAGGARGRRGRRDDDRRRARARRASSTTGSTRRSSWPRSARSRTSGISCSAASCPTPRPAAAFGAEVRRPACPPARPAHRAAGHLPAAARRSTCCAPRSRSWRPSSAGGPPTTSGPTSSTTRRSGLCAVVPTILAAAHRLRQGQEPVEPRHDLGFAANYLYMLTGSEPSAQHARAIEQYMILTIDHGFNASTFTARVVTSTGADLGAAIVAAIGALSGPLHGGAPSRALDMLDAIGTPGPGRRLRPGRRRRRRPHHGLRPPRLQDRRPALAPPALGHRAASADRWSSSPSRSSARRSTCWPS